MKVMCINCKHIKRAPASELGVSREDVRDWETHRRDCPDPVHKLAMLKYPKQKRKAGNDTE